MDHRYTHTLTELEQSLSLPFLKDNCPNTDTTQFVIPRKPVGSSQQAGVGETKEATQSSRLKLHSIGFLCFASLVAIIATVQPHQGKPLPQCPPKISVNTMISIYVVVLKGTIMLVVTEGLGQLKWIWLQNDRPLEDLVHYDHATRGPLGALNLLWRLGLRQPLSSVGALITIITLLVDPFTQQILHYHDCSVPIDGLQATMPRTNVFLQRDGPYNRSTSNWVEPDLQAAINAGIFSPNTLVSPICVAGNCTFQNDYGTVGYCSSCSDVTHDLTIDSQYVSNFTEFTLDNMTINATEFLIPGVGVAANTNISVSTGLPSGLSVTAYPGTLLNLTAMGAYQPPQGSGERYQIEIIVGKQFQLLDPATGGPPRGCDAAAVNGSWYCRGYGAARCSLAPCVRAFIGTVEAGQLHETEISASADWGYYIVPPLSLEPMIPINGPDPPSPPTDPSSPSQVYIPYLGIIDTLCLNDYEREKILDEGYHIEQDERWLAYNLSSDLPSQEISSNSSFPASMLFNGCIYIIDNLFVASLWESYLEEFFNSSVQGVAGFNGEIERLNGSQNLAAIYNYGNVSFDRVDSTFRNISDSITSFFRQNSFSKFSDPAIGTAMHDQTCLSVRWAWLAFPSTLVLFTLVFFVALLIETGPIERRAPIWKSSALALIFHGLDRPDENRANVLDMDEMERMAKTVVIRLAATGKGLNLVELGSEHFEDG